MSENQDVQGISRRAAVTKIAVGTAAVWAAPAITSLGRASAAEGSPAPTAGATKLYLVYHYTGNDTDYFHNYDIVSQPDGSFTGTGSVSDGYNEVITGTYSGGLLSLVSTYNNGLVYRVNNATVAGDGSFTGVGNIDYQTDNSPVSGTIS